jgi:ribonuclease HI
LIKRIGPGDSVNIWTDKWITGLRSMKPLMRMEGVNVEQVQELFIPGTRSWNVQLVNDSFLPQDAEEILKIRPGVRMQEDLLAWAYERHGCYSVRSCYRALKSEQDQIEAMKRNSTESSKDGFWWGALWRLNVPPKVQIFWWRALKASLPTKGELKRRHIEKEDHCEACGEPGESLYHVALKCTFALQLWKAAQEITGVRVPELHPGSWTRDVLAGDLCTPREAALIICGAWSLWSGRNARKHGKGRWNPQAAVRHVAAMVEALVCLQASRPGGPPVGQSHSSEWRTPPQGWVKVNTDATFRMSTAIGASGVIIRDSEGTPLAAAAKLYDHVADALTGEFLAARDGLELARQRGYHRIILESDSQTLVNMMRDGADDRSVVFGLWQELQELGRSFVSLNFSFVRRDGNRAAHLCATLPSVSARA